MEQTVNTTVVETVEMERCVRGSLETVPMAVSLDIWEINVLQVIFDLYFDIHHTCLY